MIPNLMESLWETTLKGGLQSIEGKVLNLTDYFNCISVTENSRFIWENIEFIPIQTIHVLSGYMFKHSYGLLITSESGYKIFVTTDTQFAPYQLHEFYRQSDVIFNDCETTSFKSHVHANYSDLNTLDKDIKNKMWLYHYGNKIDTVHSDGFVGFVEKNQDFDF